VARELARINAINFGRQCEAGEEFARSLGILSRALLVRCSSAFVLLEHSAFI
jgi:hypothetical protein